MKSYYLVVLCFLLAGCQQPDTKKSAVKMQHQKSTVVVKLNLAEQAVKDGKFEEAGAALRQCLVADPNNYKANILYAKVMLSGRAYDVAMACLETAASVDPKAAEAWYLLGTIEDSLKMNDKAIAHYEKAVSLEPENITYTIILAESKVRQGEFDAASEMALQTAQRAPLDHSIQLRTGDILCQAGRYNDAINCYRRAVEVSYDPRKATESIGYCFMYMDQWKQAARTFEKLTKDADDTVRYKYYDLTAKCYMNAGDYSRATANYEQITLENRDNADFWVQLGQAALGAGETKKALVCGRKALEINKNFTQATVLVGCAYYTQGDYTNALKYFEVVKGDDKDAAFCEKMQERCHEKLGNSKTSEKIYGTLTPNGS